MLRLRPGSPLLRFALTAAVFLCAGCGRIGYDVLAPSGAAGTFGAGGSLGVGGSVGTGGSLGAGGSLGSGGAGGASLGGSGGSSVIDASNDAFGPTDGPPPNTTCGQAGAPTQVWSFDTDLQGWELSGPGTMVWTGAVGDPALGAVQVDFTGTTHPRLVQALGNLSGHIITAEVWVDMGTNVLVKLFVQTGTKLVWADGGAVTPTPGQWTCLALDIDNPAFSKNMYDPTNVTVVGFELGGNGNSRVYFDQFGY